MGADTLVAMSGVDGDASTLPGPPSSDAGLGAAFADEPDDLQARQMLAGLRRRLAGTDVAPITLDRYRLGDKLGEGGMGVVYRAHDPRLERDVALKVLHRGAATARLRREARALAALSDPHIVQVYDVGEWEGQTFIAMELVEGPTLHTWLAAGLRSVPEVLDAFVAAGQGLAAAHRASVIHRDFKPTNVLVADPDGRPRIKVADFGLAKTTAAPSTSDSDASADGPLSGPSAAETANRSSNHHPTDRITKTGAQLGTPAYMAPEQALGRLASAKADQFSWCVSLFEALASGRPFGDDVAWLVLPERARQGPQPERLAAIPRRLRPVLVRGLACEPDDRYADMDALLAAVVRARGRARWPWVAGIGAIGTLAVAGSSLSPSPDPCASITAKLDHAWSTETIDRGRAAFEATEVVHAGSTWDEVAQRMNAGVDGWRAERTEVCRASTKRREAPDLLATRSCLAQWRRDATALIETLSQAEATTVDRALGLVDRLGSPKECRNATLVAEPPEDLEGPVEEIRQELALVGALGRAGLVSRMVEPATRAHAAAKALAFAPLRAEAMAYEGQARLLNGEAEAGVEMLAEAFWAASELELSDVALRAAGFLSQGYGYFLHDAEQTRAWVGHADAVQLRRAVRDDLAVFQQIQAAIGLEAIGDFEQAGRRLSAALDDARRTPKAQARVGAILHNLGSIRYRQGRYAEAEAMVRDAIEEGERTVGAQHSDIGVARNTLGGILMLTGDLEGAQRELELARTIMHAGSAAPHNLAMNATTLGSVAQMQGRLAEAVEHLTEAAEQQRQATSETHPLYAQALDTLALAQWSAGSMDDAYDSLTRAYALADAAVGPDALLTIVTRTHLGSIEAARSAATRDPDRSKAQLDAAIAHYRAAADAGAKALGPDHPRVADALNGLATSLLTADNPEAALSPAERALGILERSGAMPVQLASAQFAVASAMVGADPPNCRVALPHATCLRVRELVEKAARNYGETPTPEARLGRTQLRKFAELYFADPDRLVPP